MNKHIVLKALTVLGIISACALALSALLVPEYRGEDRKAQTQGLFIKDKENISAVIELKNGNEAHFLGERFFVTVIVQYRAKVIEPDINSFTNSSLGPFEIVSTQELKTRRRGVNVQEKRLLAQVVSIEGLPGFSYKLKPAQIRYKDLSQKRVGIIEVPWPKTFYISSYYNKDVTGKSLRPLKQPTVSNHVLKSLFWLGAGLMALCVALSMVSVRLFKSFFKRRDSLDTPTDIELLVRELKLFYDEDFLKESPVNLLRHLEKMSMRAVSYAGITPSDFWTLTTPTVWKKLVYTLNRAYKQADLIRIQDVKEARDALLVVLKTLKQAQRQEGR